MEVELASRLDEFSQEVVIAQPELLLTYANRFYKRQFLTRKAVHSDLLQRLEETLADCFRREDLLSRGIPTVQYLAQCLHVSPSYLSDMLRTLTGQSAQQHSQGKACYHRPVSERGSLRAEFFNRFFKAKTAQSLTLFVELLCFVLFFDRRSYPGLECRIYEHGAGGKPRLCRLVLLALLLSHVAGSFYRECPGASHGGSALLDLGGHLAVNYERTPASQAEWLLVADMKMPLH
jgi:AraC-like DNA-binding protein